VIKFWSWIYRRTGYYSVWAKAAEYNALILRLKAVQGHLLHPDNDMGLAFLIDVEVGIWQAKNGFTRRWNGKR